MPLLLLFLAILIGLSILLKVQLFMFVAVCLVAFPGYLAYNILQYFYRQISKSSKSFSMAKFAIGYMVLLSISLLYIILLRGCTFHFQIFLTFSVLLYILNYILLRSTSSVLKRAYSCLLLTCVQILVLITMRLFVMLVVLYIGFACFYLLLLIVGIVFHGIIIKTIIKINQCVTVWLRTAMLCLAVLALRLFCFESEIFSDVIMLGPVFCMGSGGASTTGISLLSRSFTTVQAPHLVIKSCTIHESEMLQAVWHGNSKAILEKAQSLLKSGNWMATKEGYNQTKRSFPLAGNKETDFNKMVRGKLRDFVQNREPAFVIEAFASSEELLKPYLNWYKNNGTSISTKDNMALADYLISQDRRTGLLTAENKLCAGQLCGRFGRGSISHLDLVKTINEVPQLLDLATRTGSLQEIMRPGEHLGDWCYFDKKEKLRIVEAKTYDHFREDKYVMTPEADKIFSKIPKTFVTENPWVKTDIRLMSHIEKVHKTGLDSGKNVELMVYVSDLIESDEAVFPFQNTSGSNTMTISVRSLYATPELEPILLWDVQNLSLYDYDKRENIRALKLHKVIDDLRYKKR